VPVLCKDVPKKINYASNGDVSASLKLWLEDTQGSVDSAKWESVWSSPTKTSIHRLKGKYLWVYIVYFKDTAAGFDANRTYDVSSNVGLTRRV
jgi:hypothetical protein